MKILYVGRHDSGGNDDEGAIAHALRQLGHTLHLHQERSIDSYYALSKSADLLLCHHCHDLAALAAVKIPKIVWCFDLIDWPEPVARHEQRRRWAKDITSICDLAFFTDGNWVAADKTGKAHWLTQGADERPCEGTVEIEGFQIVKPIDVLFVGSLGYGRETFVRELRERYGGKFKHILKGCHGSALASEISRAKIVVAPDSPVTDRYWSNRVYNMMRLGAFLVHPYIKNLMDQVDSHGWWYGDREGMFGIIDDWIPRDKSRKELTQRSQEIVLLKHTYRHRCASLIQTVKERLKL